MSKPLQENPITDIPSSSSSSLKKSLCNYSFYVKMKPLRKLRIALGALADPAFNDNGLGLVDVDDKGFYITVQNINNAFARLWLNPSGMIIFHQKPNSMIGKFVRLGPISHSFPAGLDGFEDVVHVFNLLGSNELRFQFGTAPFNEFSTEFVIIDTPYTRFPNFTRYCDVIVPTNDLREMIECLRQSENSEIVYAGIMPYSAKFEIGSERTWKYDYPHTKEGRIKGVSLDEFHMECFNWTYNMFLIRASYLQDKFVVRFLDAPKERIIFQFIMQELGHMQKLGDLMIIKENISKSIW